MTSDCLSARWRLGALGFSRAADHTAVKKRAVLLMLLAGSWCSWASAQMPATDAVQTASAIPADTNRPGVAGDTHAVQEIRSLIASLGADSFRERTWAESNLFAIGRQAIPELAAAKHHDDPEVRERVNRLLTRLNPAEPPKERAARVHVVQPGEDLYTVALMWGVSVAELQRINSLVGTRLAPGQRLRIPVER